jgi:PPP family 3-phenylpropionic acid transporter
MVGLRLFYFLFFVGLGIYSPAFPRWLEANGIRGFELGLVAATSPVMGLVSPALLGFLADRSGRRRAVVVGTTALAALSVAVLALVSSRGSPGFALTLTCVGVFAFFRAPMGSLADTIALESGAPYGPLRLWGSLGFLLAAVLAGRYLEPTSRALLFGIAAALGMAGLAALLLPARVPVVRGTEGVVVPKVSALALVRREPVLQLLFVCALLIESAHSAYDLCYSFHLRDEGFSPQVVGVLWGIGVLAEVAFFLVSQRLLARFDAGLLLVAGAAAIAVRLGFMAQAHGLWTLVALQSLHALTFGATWTALMQLVREQSRPESLGALRGLLSATSAVGGTLGMAVWGTSYRAFGGLGTFRAAAAVGALAALVGAACARRLASAAPAAARAAQAP